MLRLRRLHHGRIPHGKIGIPGGGILQNLTMSSEGDFSFFLSVHAEWSGLGSPERSTDNWTVVYTEYTPTACMTYNTVCSQARMDTE